MSYRNVTFICVCKHSSLYEPSQEHTLQGSEFKETHERKQKADGIWIHNNYSKNNFKTCDIWETNASFEFFSQERKEQRQ